MHSDRDRWQIDLLPVATLVMWLTCLSIGLIGKYITAAPPARARPVPQPAEMRFIKVALTQSPALAAQSSAPPAPAAPDVIPPAPTPIPISAPAPFAIAAKKRVIPKSPALAKPSGPVYQQIVFGQGEGEQPPPDYPYECQVAGQTGTVVVQFVVGTDGHITSAEAAQPCSWPLLNQAAVRSIRDNWTYPPGPVRYYSVKIIYAPKQSQ